MSSRYTVETNGDVSLSAATAKTILNVINASNSVTRITEFAVSFDGVTGNAEPVTVELCKSTQAGAGTAAGSPTPVQVGGPTRTVVATAGRGYTAEPTVLTVIKRWLVHPAGGGLHIQSPLGREVEQITSGNGLAIRCTAPAAVNAQAFIEFEEG